MKKITQLFMLAVLVLNSSSMFAQVTNETGLSGDDLIYYEDMRYENGNSGFSNYITTATKNPARGSNIPTGDDAPYTRPATNYPAGDPVDNKVWNIKCNDASVNYDVDVWFIVNTVDLSAYDSGNKYFTINTLTKYFEDGTADNNSSKNVTFMYATDFEQGTDPTTVTWTELAVPVVSPVYGADGVWTTLTFDLSSITCGTKFALSVRVQTSANGPNPDITDYDGKANRNGTYYLSDIIYTGTKPSLGISEDNFNVNFSVYPNPTVDVLNIKSLNNDFKVDNVSLFDYSGKSIYSNNKIESIRMNDFSKGVYFLRIESKEGKVLTKKIMLK